MGGANGYTRGEEEEEEEESFTGGMGRDERRGMSVLAIAELHRLQETYSYITERE